MMWKRFTTALALAAFAACALTPKAPPLPREKPKGNENCNSFRLIPVEIIDSYLNENNARTLKELNTSACREDMIGWHFINTTTKEVKIKLTDFHVCDAPTNKVSGAVKFKGGLFDDDSDEAVAPGRSVTMVGRVKGGTVKCVDYTIRLNGRIHDPRLQIVDP